MLSGPKNLMKRAARIAVAASVLFANIRMVYAETVPLLRGPETDQQTLEAFARAEDRMTLAEYYDANRPTKLNEEKITRLLEKAQAQWLGGTIDAARITFKEIANLLADDDWRDAHREAVAYSMLRLAQSAESPMEANEWIEKAAQSVPEYQPEATLFPPPIIKSLNESRSRVRALAKEISFAESFPEYRFVLINGKKFEVHAKTPVRLPPGNFRLSAFSDSRAPIVEKLNATQLARFKVATPPLALGTCGSPQFFDVPRYSGSVAVLFDKHCVRTRSDTASSEAKPIGNIGIERSNETKWPTDEKPTHMSTAAKVTWIALGLSALTAGILIAVEQSKPQQQQERSTEPTFRQGF